MNLLAENPRLVDYSKLADVLAPFPSLTWAYVADGPGKTMKGGTSFKVQGGLVLLRHAMLFV